MHAHVFKPPTAPAQVPENVKGRRQGRWYSDCEGRGTQETLGWGVYCKSSRRLLLSERQAQELKGIQVENYENVRQSQSPKPYKDVAFCLSGGRQ